MSNTCWQAIVALTVVAIGVGCASAAEDGTLRFDFETGDLQGWEMVEGDFDKILCNREFEFHNKVKYTKQGDYYLSTLERKNNDRPDDSPMGIIESPVFVITGPKASMRVGGGSHDTTYVALCTIDGKEQLVAKGRNAQMMHPVTWDVTPWIGQKVFLRVVDRHRSGWGHLTFDDFSVEGRIDADATRARAKGRKAEIAARLHKQLEEIEVPLRLAIEDLAATYGKAYPAKEFLSRLDSSKPTELETLRREALLANQLVCGQPILFVVRQQYRSDHHNTATMFQTGEINTASFQGGGAIKTLDVTTGETKTLLDVPEGVARDPDVRFDGKKILFSMRRDLQDDYHLYEMNADGAEVTQLTFGSEVSDIDPIYLPDGRVLFTSTREPKYCMCNRHIMGNLFTMNADGSNIQQIGHSTLHEGHSAVLPDGRIIYDRWEYVDRNFGDAQGVWVTNPDGTNHAIYWGNNTNSPGGVLDARAIPNTELFISTFSSCHDRPWGALAIVDRRLGLDGREPVIRTWPASAMDLIGKGNYDTFKKCTPKYEDPYPLSDKYFLCSRMTGEGEQMGIYLIDMFGNEILVHAEQPGCFDPMPLAPRDRPHEIPSRVDLAKTEGTFRVENVYLGSGMERVEPGSVKYLRVVESPEKRFWSTPAWNGGTGTQAPGMAWDDFNNKRILGTVPVNKDGSVEFSVPADTFVYFQLLDEKGMMVQSMRSGTIVRPGEAIGCVGCHEDRRTAGQLEYASRGRPREPLPLQPWYGEPRLFSYTVEVQPVFDKHCVSCHTYGEEAGEKLNLAGDPGLVFNKSYSDLRSKGYVHVVGAGPTDVQMPKTWGSHASRLTKVLLEGHGKPEIDEKVQLDPESFDRLVTWIDINAPYYPTYAGGAYRNNPYGRSPLSDGELNQLSTLLGTKVKGRNFHDVSFNRPELSPALAALQADPAKHQEALTLLRLGKERFAKTPRADMPGFQLDPSDEVGKEERYQKRLEQENRMRTALIHGERFLLKPGQLNQE
jgi:hydrazine synthase alpha subunit-like protein/WD40 repeat protein